MGVNTLAFRGAQHGAFYVADADCVGVTTAVPWALNRQWLDLLARSGTMLFMSLAPDALGAQQRQDLRTAFAIAATPQPLGQPLDWQHNVYPERWRLMDESGRSSGSAPMGLDHPDGQRTSVGVSRSSIVPSPSSPFALLPQHRTMLLVVTPQL